ncbi:glycerophosphoryl diester phosphodiesterase [Formosa sp. Hel1_31_208]|uniref:glycerophosphodiester phosphodiesterase n=1 Tax=Formosa sp. Hel1_31_208 TaxID=1798225 RepID=UPI0008799CE7|nr:glycerophosphodiester phosphodiesterase family protein [Formosa sp. Hel1_31_208]SDR86916.1 glycerophosphoryl diester phosphodiesterase [Formosa sp. Hel1_31_208]
MTAPLNIGHRGAKAHIAENTLASIKRALDLGVDGVEIDVHKCASGELVVFHDFTLDRMTNGSGEIAKHTWSQLQNLKIDEQFSIPSLTQVLDLINKKCLLNIELKGKDTATETCRLIADYVRRKDWHENQFLISSFQHQELEQVCQLNTNLRLGVLTKASVTDALVVAKRVNAYAIHPNVALLSKANVKLAKEKGYKVITWTVNDDETIERMRLYGVDGIISDYPDKLKGINIFTK